MTNMGRMRVRTIKKGKLCRRLGGRPVLKWGVSFISFFFWTYATYREGVAQLG